MRGRKLITSIDTVLHRKRYLHQLTSSGHTLDVIRATACFSHKMLIQSECTFVQFTAFRFISLGRQCRPFVQISVYSTHEKIIPVSKFQKKIVSSQTSPININVLVTTNMRKIKQIYLKQ